MRKVVFLRVARGLLNGPHLHPTALVLQKSADGYLSIQGHTPVAWSERQRCWELFRVSVGSLQLYPLNIHLPLLDSCIVLLTVGLCLISVRFIFAIPFAESCQAFAGSVRGECSVRVSHGSPVHRHQRPRGRVPAAELHRLAYAVPSTRRSRSRTGDREEKELQSRLEELAAT